MFRIRGVASNRAGLATVLAALFVLLIWPVEARVARPAPTTEPVAVCACCADDGEWYETTERLDSSHNSELERVRFSATANRLESAADEDDLASTFTLSHRRTGRRWELRFRDQAGKTGTLTFTLPASATFFGTDMREMPPGSAGPILYKELRLSGAAQATGIFKSGAGPQRFRLIFQGRGNNCPAAEDFKHWTLQLSGGRRTLSFYGTMETPN
jgi:hypothetical protein